MTRPCTQWLDRDIAMVADKPWEEHLAGCSGCRREFALDQLLAQQRIKADAGFAASVMRAIVSNQRNMGAAAIAASLLLMLVAGWLLSAAPGGGLAETLLALCGDALTVGWGWLGASWVGLRTAVRPNLSPQTVIGMALMMTAFSILTWRLVNRRPATSKHRSR